MAEEIIITTTIEEILNEIDNAGHEAFMESESCDWNRNARKAMTAVIRKYQNLIIRGRMKVVGDRKR